MSDDTDDKPAARGRESPDEARRKLAENWAAMTASMVSPDAAAPRVRPSSRPPAPLPVDGPPSNVTPLPLPADAAPAPLPTPQAEPQQPTPPPEPMQPTQPAPAQPAAPEPRLAPVSRPASGTQPTGDSMVPTSASATPAGNSVEALSGPTAVRAAAAEQSNPEQELTQGRNNLTAAVTFTIFAIVVAMAMTFATQYSTNPAGSDGSGTLLATFVSIGLAWTISLGHRLLGRFWLAWYLVPVVILLLGPFISGVLWMRNQEALARSYLSPAGSDALIDADSNTLASTTVYAKQGCFTLVRNRETKETTVMAASRTPATARQHADMALAPRFAAHVPAGGPTTAGHVFIFPDGTGPPRVEAPEQAPLDCGSG
jgi:hypothetical protein